MSDATSAGTGSTPIVVPADVQAKFGGIVSLILASESMNEDERRYWIDILPAMTPEQIAKLQEILSREKEQLAAIDAKYSQGMTQFADAKAAVQSGEERVQRQSQRAATEAEIRANETQAAEGLLDQLDNV